MTRKITARDEWLAASSTAASSSARNSLLRRLDDNPD
jgi:hypothetical protein